jgi:hypothetical protein
MAKETLSLAPGRRGPISCSLIKSGHIDVRFTPNSDRESGHDYCGMSALPPKADMCVH